MYSEGLTGHLCRGSAGLPSFGALCHVLLPRTLSSTLRRPGSVLSSSHNMPGFPRADLTRTRGCGSEDGHWRLRRSRERAHREGPLPLRGLCPGAGAACDELPGPGTPSQAAVTPPSDLERAERWEDPGARLGRGHPRPAERGTCPGHTGTGLFLCHPVGGRGTEEDCAIFAACIIPM